MEIYTKQENTADRVFLVITLIWWICILSIPMDLFALPAFRDRWLDQPIGAEQCTRLVFELFVVIILSLASEYHRNTAELAFRGSLDLIRSIAFITPPCLFVWFIIDLIRSMGEQSIPSLIGFFFLGVVTLIPLLDLFQTIKKKKLVQKNIFSLLLSFLLSVIPIFSARLLIPLHILCSSDENIFSDEFLSMLIAAFLFLTLAKPAQDLFWKSCPTCRNPISRSLSHGLECKRCELL